MDKKQMLQPFFVLRGKVTSLNCEIKKFFGGSQNETNTKHAEKQQQKGTNIRNLQKVRKKTGNQKNKNYISYYLIFATSSLV